jgi:hypothetical protein
MIIKINVQVSISQSASFSSITDRPIVLENEKSTININKRANPRNPKNEWEFHRNFNSRIPILLFNLEKRDRDEGND